MSSLNCIRREKSASEYQNAELMRLAFLRPYLVDATFSNARSASLRQNAGLMKSPFLKCRQTNAIISNARSASLLNRDTKAASQSQNVRVASVLQNVNSASLNLAFLRLVSQSYDVRLHLLSDGSIRRELKSPHPQRLEAGPSIPLRQI